MVKIKTAATQTPPYSRTTKEIIPYIKTWLTGQEERFQRKVIKIIGNAGIDIRHSIIDADDMFTDRTFEDKNNLYIKGVLPLSEQVLRKALAKAEWAATDLDYLITVSCTGFMIPSVGAYLVNSVGLRQDVVRLPVTEMGCAAGVSGIIYAKNFLQSNPGKRAAVIAVESPMSTFHKNDFSMVNIVSAALFGDGAACVLLSSDENEEGPVVQDEGMYHFFDTTEMMGFQLNNDGLLMQLHPSVPEKIEAHFPKIVHPFLEKSNTSIEEVDHFVFHPGGKKIVRTIERLFGASGKNINDTKEVLRIHGNMSSATVLYVLERFMDKAIPKGEKGLMLSFGPGFSAHQVLLEW